MDTDGRLGWGVVYIIVLALVVFGLWGMFSAKYTKGYSLSGEKTSLIILHEIENAEDAKIPLIGVDYERAVALVDSLNKTLPENIRQR